VEIRRARLEDAAGIASVHVRTWQAAYEHVFGAERLATFDLDARTRRWEAWLTAGENASVAVADGRVLAFVWVGSSREAPDEGEVFAIYALPEAWGSSAGRQLMAVGLAALRERGFAEAILWVLADNPRARRFYEREGWQTDGGLKREEFLDVEVEEVRYRITL
jgi:ribosomal protein S18 acetylase RimI-like enzyme